MGRPHSMLPREFKKPPQFGGLVGCLNVELYKKYELCSLPLKRPPFVPFSFRPAGLYIHIITCSSHHIFFLSPSSSPNRSCHSSPGEKSAAFCGRPIVIATRGPEVITVKPWHEEAQASSFMETCLHIITHSWFAFLPSQSRLQGME